MKSKVFGFKVLLILLAVLTAGMCFSFGVVKHKTQKPVAVAQSTKVTLGEEGEKEEYSALFGGNVIFSAEKVLVTKENGLPLITSENFYYGRSNGQYSFKHIPQVGSRKTVVDNGEFIVFENIVTNDDYVLSAPGEETQEALMISLGGYYFDQTVEPDETFDEQNAPVDIHEVDKGAKITWLEVVAYKNGNKLAESDIVTREYLDGSVAYYDFAYLIKHNVDNSNEGFYKFTFTYMINGYEYSGEFEFYLINKASYNQELNNVWGYNAKPTVGWFGSSGEEFVKCSDGGEAALYKIGGVPLVSNELSYPTITYDYTKYRLKYTHSANRINSKWEFDWKAKAGGRAEMVYSSTVRDDVKGGTFDLIDYRVDNSVNLVTIMLTEPGSYTIEYEAYYAGYNSDIAPVNIGIKPGVLRLDIVGLIAKYSKANQESARLDYFNIVSNKNNNVDLFIPNGYDVDKDLTGVKEEVGFAYKLVEDEEVRDGFIKKEEKTALKNSKLHDTLKDADSKLRTLITQMSNMIGDNNLKMSEGQKQDAEEVLFTEISAELYASTNQASIWLSGNTASSKNSFYIYSAKTPTASNLFEKVKTPEGGAVVADAAASEYQFRSNAAKKFTNTSTFNKTGYYLVFIEVQLDNEIDLTKTKNYWQVFAFQYVSASVNINVQAIINKTEQSTETQIIEGGAFTNKNVEVSWKIPGVFDREIKASYFVSNGKILTRSEFLKTNVKNFESILRDETNGFFKAELGEDVKDETFVQYMIRLVDEEGSATYKMFTIDRQSISGVKPYLVKELYFGNSVYYALATNDKGEKMWINNSITDSLATLMWDNKASGAPITATYDYIPFNLATSSEADEHPIEKINNGKNGLITTNYTLGTEVTKSFTPVENVTDIKSSSIMSGQGIYLFKIKDAAGNGCLFMFVVDKTENYFEIKLGETIKYVKNELVVYGNDVEYNIGDAKLIHFDESSSTIGKLVNDFVTRKTLDDLTQFEELKYYQGAGNNFEAIKSLFTKVGDKKYLNVKNEGIIAYTLEDEIDKKISKELVHGTLKDTDKKEGESYYKRILYAVGKNHIFTTMGDRNLSKVTIEINKDNSLLFVHFGEGSLNEESDRLDTGSDEINGDFKGLTYAKATSIKNIAISWKTGSGKYEVDTVTLTKYPLNLTKYDESKFYYSESSEGPVELMSSTEQSGEEGRVIYRLGDIIDANCLYVVTRKYKNSQGEDFGDDVAEKNYYFIIDSYNIIENSDNDNIGKLIKIELLEDEKNGYNEFSSVGIVPVLFSIDEKDVVLKNKLAYIYLTTNKVPATLKVPAGKFDRYLTDQNNISSSGGYYSGKLNVQIFFKDEYKQLPKDSEYQGRTVMLFNSKRSDDSKDVIIDQDGYIEIDLSSYVEKAGILNRILGDEKDWMFLPGDYIIRIFGNVKGDEAKNEKYICLRIESGNKGPNGDGSAKITINNGVEGDAIGVSTIPVGNAKFAYEATVSQEYLEVVIPKEVIIPKDESVEIDYKNPRIDHEYVVIKQFNDGVEVPYFTYSSDKENKDKYLDKGDAAYAVKLNTMLRDDKGNIILENLAKELKYEIKIRYRIRKTGDESDSTRFANCYVYYDENGNKISYYEATITITIDRQAPLDNIEELNKNDALVEKYCEEFKVDSMTENNINDMKSYVYFNHQYSAYYNNKEKDKGYIYPYQVNENTEFKKGDIVKVYSKPIEDLSTYKLTLPFVGSTGYTAVSETVLTSKELTYEKLTYGDILSQQTLGGYYEIIEQDGAGNTTQYVVHYLSKAKAPNIGISVDCLLTNSQNNEPIELSLNGVAEDENNNVLHLFNIKPSDAETERTGYNFVIQMFNASTGELIYEKLTTPSTKFDSLSSDIVQKMNNFGTYKIVLKGRTVLDENGVNLVEKTYVIYLYNSEDRKTIQIEDLIERTNDGCRLIFNKALVKDEENGLVYYAININIVSKDSELAEQFTGKYDVDAGALKFYNNKGEEVSVYEFSNPDVVYKITMLDVLNYSQTHRFSPSGKEFYKVEFENPNKQGDWGAYYYIDDKGVYYGYTNARVFYDDGVFEAKKPGTAGEEDYVSETILEASYVNKDDTDKSTNDEYVIKIFDKHAAGDEVDSEKDSEKIYEIKIVSNLGKVTLRDYSTSVPQQTALSRYNNMNFDDKDVKSDKSLTGIMNLQWDIVSEFDAITYQYIIHEELLEGGYRLDEDGSEGIKLEVDSSQQTGNYTVNTKSDSTGRYIFEIKVFGNNGKYLGNRLYAFEVHKANDKVYYVRDDAENKAITYNSTFTLKDLAIIIPDDNSELKEMQNNIEYPLYISNSSLTVITVGSLVESESVYEGVPGFTIHKISKGDSFSLFIGLYIVNSLEKRVGDVRLFAPNINEEVLSNTEYSITKYGNKETSDDVKLSVGFESNNTEDQEDQKGALTRRNKLFLDVYYENELVKSKELIDNDDTDSCVFEYFEKGNGKYSYVVRDLAGNKYVYKNNKDVLSLFILREIVLKLNAQVPIENGYYNDSVVMEIFEKENYVPGSINVRVKFNGEETSYSNLEYEFTEYGTYRINVSAKYTNHNDDEIPLSKEIVFTILNKREVARSVDLSCLGNCEIVSVVNGNGEVVTKPFMQMLNSSDEGLNVTYDLIMKHSTSLGVSAGKLTFAITYKISDGIYPDRTHVLEICLNNQKPSIDCSLKKGDKTTKGFTITYNGAILYQQIGEAEIRINGKTAALINEDSSNAVSRISKSFKSSGAGDYYVQIVSSSGEVWESFKVTIKEPLNSWAIIVIVVVSLVVAAVVITIVVLRRKMRIR